MQDILIQAQGVAKVYSHKPILRGIDLAIRRGQAVAFMGHNGAGKTTLLRLLSGLTAPSKGRVTHTPGISFAYVPEHFPKMAMTAAQYLAHMARLEGLCKKAAADRCRALLADFFLEDMADVPMKHLSKGSLQKVGVIQALLARHDVLMLDEPLSGQDVESQDVFIRKVLQARDEGTAMLLSCHEERLTRRLADTVYTIDKGALSVRALEDAMPTPRDILVFAFNTDAQDVPDVPDAEDMVVSGHTIRMAVPVARSNTVAVRLIGAGYRLTEMHHEKDR